MTMEETDNRITDCIEYICDQYNVPATLRFSGVVRDRTQHTMMIAFLDVMTSSYFTVEDREILDKLATQGIKHKKDYRKLRSLIRMKLINAIYNLRNLTEESLRNLGVKEI